MFYHINGLIGVKNRTANILQVQVNLPAVNHISAVHKVFECLQEKAKDSFKAYFESVNINT